MNQDLALWLERVNARPAGETARQQEVSAVALASEPARQPVKTASPLSPTLPTSSVAPSSAPSPTASLAVQPATEAKPRPVSTSPDSTVVSGDTSSPSAAPTGAAALASSQPQEKAAPAAAAADSPLQTPSAQPVAPPKPTWVANPGSTVRETLAHWSSKAGWAVPQWDAEIDYQVPGTLSFEGDFLDAVRGLFKAYARAKRPLLVDAYPNQKIIHVTE
ncbi:toxin co-regulated pilus biosynthesis Q family protein [Stenotrophomonas sp. PvP093]|uniref:toxin co-regulated pilus biosynthesis Q family protein n=1 Tax=unclassified Stenotrophomonas TaxID=196198 RepID=UPI001FD8A743|nr:toxin co-regulated pilus biosynthesis Q family protein [Stenotrophomonas sp. PvP093]